MVNRCFKTLRQIVNLEMNLVSVSTLFILYSVQTLAENAAPIEEEKYGVKYADRCEVCKYMTVELSQKLKETGDTHGVVETGYSFDERLKRKIKYRGSELRLVESLDGICERLLAYNVHKERQDSTRFAKGMSQTFQTLHGLVDKGVKVDLGIPYELWDKPSAEVTHMKTQYESMLEQFEEDIENWYWSAQDTPLYKYLCVDRVLKKGDLGCLDEMMENDKQQAGYGVKQAQIKSGLEDNEL